MLTALLLLSSFPIVASLVCDNCIVYSGNQCVNYGDCQGNYCLYEYARQSNGQTMLKKSCLNTPYVQFDDGTLLTVYNECVSKSTGSTYYNVKMCNNGNYCNRDCTNPQPLPNPNPINPLTNGQVTCYSCSTSDGSDCNSNTCTGNYCTYLREEHSNGGKTLQKACSNVPSLQLDDGTTYTLIDKCSSKLTPTSTYYGKICNSNYCNAACESTNDNNNNNNNNNGNPQYQPLVTCYSCVGANAYDCSGTTCQGNYCMYERVTRTDGIPNVKRSCLQVPYILYPDNSRTQTLNQCEYKTVNGVSYAAEVCNSGSFCAKVCSHSPSITSLISLFILPLCYLLR